MVFKRHVGLHIGGNAFCISVHRDMVSMKLRTHLSPSMISA